MRNPFQKKTNQDVWLKAGAGLGAALLAGIFAWLRRDDILDILEFLKGKSLSVLGERRVGKTVLIDFLTSGTLPKEYVQTLYPQKTIPNDLKLKDLKLRIKKSIDVPGSEDFCALWKDLTRKSDIVLYLLRVDMMEDKDTQERVKRDLGQIESWLRESPKEFPLFIIGTHCDLTDTDFTKLPKHQKGYYVDDVRSKPIFRLIEQIAGGGGRVRFAFGSLKSQDATESLVYEILDQVVNYNG